MLSVVSSAVVSDAGEETNSVLSVVSSAVVSEAGEETNSLLSVVSSVVVSNAEGGATVTVLALSEAIFSRKGRPSTSYFFTYKGTDYYRTIVSVAKINWHNSLNKEHVSSYHSIHGSNSSFCINSSVKGDESETSRSSRTPLINDLGTQ